MSILFTALAALQAAPAAQPATPPVAAPAARTLKDLPKVSVTYYDVTGKDMKAINKSLLKARGKDPVTKQPNTVTTKWNVAPGIKRRTEADGKCTVVEVVGHDFSGTVELPRLANATTVPAAVMADWQSFASQLEKDAAAKLWYVHDRLPEFDRTVLNKPCDQAMKDGTAFLEKLKADAVAFQPPQAPKAATASASRDPVKPIDD